LSAGLIADGIVGKSSFERAEKIKGDINLGSQQPASNPVLRTPDQDGARPQQVHPVLADKVGRMLILAAAQGFSPRVT
jgi:hypothetical protein